MPSLLFQHPPHLFLLPGSCLRLLGLEVEDGLLLVSELLLNHQLAGLDELCSDLCVLALLDVELRCPLELQERVAPEEHSVQDEREEYEGEPEVAKTGSTLGSVDEASEEESADRCCVKHVLVHNHEAVDVPFVHRLHLDYIDEHDQLHVERDRDLDDVRAIEEQDDEDNDELAVHLQGHEGER